MKTTKCPKCQSENVQVSVPLRVSAPATRIGKFSKRMFRQKNVRIQSADFDKADYTCYDCKHTWGHSKDIALALKREIRKELDDR